MAMGSIRYRGIAGLPSHIRKAIEFTPAGKARSRRRVVWFFRYMEMGDASQAARDAGYPAKYSAQTGHFLRQEFAPLIFKAMQYQGVMDLPLMRATLVGIVRGYDPTATVTSRRVLRDGSVEEYEIPDPAKAGAPMAAVAVKAIETYFDRFGVPKTTNLNISHDEGDVGADFRLLIDRLVGSAGLEAVLRMPTIMGHKEYRDYVMKKWGEPEEEDPKVIEMVPAEEELEEES